MRCWGCELLVVRSKYGTATNNYGKAVLCYIREGEREREGGRVLYIVFSLFFYFFLLSRIESSAVYWVA